MGKHVGARGCVARRHTGGSDGERRRRNGQIVGTRRSQPHLGHNLIQDRAPGIGIGFNHNELSRKWPRARKTNPSRQTARKYFHDSNTVAWMSFARQLSTRLLFTPPSRQWHLRKVGASGYSASHPPARDSCKVRTCAKNRSGAEPRGCRNAPGRANPGHRQSRLDYAAPAIGRGHAGATGRVCLLQPGVAAQLPDQQPRWLRPAQRSSPCGRSARPLWPTGHWLGAGVQRPVVRKDGRLNWPVAGRVR